MASANGFAEVPVSRVVGPSELVLLKMAQGNTEPPLVILDSSETAIFRIGNTQGGADVDIEMLGGWFQSDTTTILTRDNSSLPAI